MAIATIEQRLKKLEEVVAPAAALYAVDSFEVCESHEAMMARVRAHPDYDPQADNHVLVFRGFWPNFCPHHGTRHSHRHDPVKRLHRLLPLRER